MKGNVFTAVARWKALHKKCTTPALTNRYDELTVQLAHGWLGLEVAIEVMECAIQFRQK